MTKQDIIDEILMELSLVVDKQFLPTIKNTLIVKMKDLQIIEQKNELSVEVHDTDYILGRFKMDCMASGKKESTIKQYVNVVIRFLSEINLPISSITSQHITDYLAIRQYRDKISINYKATIFRYLDAFFKWAYKRKFIQTNIMTDVDTCKSIVVAKERVSDEDVERIKMSPMPLKHRAFIELMLSTGMRASEICGLRIEDLDLSHNKVSIFGVKTNTRRTGFIGSSCKVALQAYLGNRTSGYVFEGRHGDKITREALNAWIKRILRNAQLHISASVHTFRKTFASITYRKTQNILLVSQLLGHSDTGVTIKHYLSLDIDNTLNEMRKVC